MKERRLSKNEDGKTILFDAREFDLVGLFVRC